jgi:hypothetical protein
MMSKTDAILSKGNKLYEDKAYILLWTKFLGLSLLMLTSYYVYDKKNKQLIKLNSRERAHLLQVSYYLTKEYRVPPQAASSATSLFKDFSQAIANRGGQTWTDLFTVTPKDKALAYSKQVAQIAQRANNQSINNLRSRRR